MSFVLDGKYYKSKPDVSKLQQPRQSTYKEWDHDKQRQEHGADIVQPRDRRGNPNPEFIALYPDAAADYGFVEGEVTTRPDFQGGNATDFNS